MLAYLFIFSLLFWLGWFVWNVWNSHSYRKELRSIQERLMKDAYGDTILINRAIVIDQTRNGKATYKSSKRILEGLQIHQ